MSVCILSSAYAPPIEWFQKAIRYDEVYIEQCDNYVKQTYRNRCIIASTAGRQALTVPVTHGNSRLGRDVTISDHGNWQHLHWQAMCSAYGESPYFEFLADDLHPFYTEQCGGLLYDFNRRLVLKVCELMNIHPNFKQTEQYVPFREVPRGVDDFRDSITPKQQHVTGSDMKPYWQVYSRKNGFLTNLSILDLLFNEGPEGVRILL